MTQKEKQQITAELKQYVERYGSQNQAANTLRDVSSATVSQMLNGKWELIKDDMFRTVAAQIRYQEEKWQIVETRDFSLLTHMLEDAQRFHNVFAITGNSGSGKTIALRHYATNNKRAHLLQCSEFWNRKYFLAELLTTMGRNASGLTVSELMIEVVRQLKKQDDPLIIIDEADKLSDQVLYFFITIYNQLEDHCGIVLAATNHLEKRIRKGLRLNKKGYNEIYSRIGRKCVELNGVGVTDVTQVCMANGINDRKTIKNIIEDSEYDLRRVKRKIHALKQKENHKND